MAALKPCGTPAAYRRHRRNGEEACGPCKAAVRVKEGSRKAEARSESAARALAAVPDVEVSDPDPLEVARSNLEIVERALFRDDVSPSAIARLTERREQLVEKIRRLNGADKAEVSVLDQLAQRRKNRVANS